MKKIKDLIRRLKNFCIDLRELSNLYDRLETKDKQIIELFKQLNEHREKLNNIGEFLHENTNVAIDHGVHSGSWAVISIEGQRSHYLKFLNLGRKDSEEIMQFMRYMEKRTGRRVQIDCAPHFYGKFNSSQY